MYYQEHQPSPALKPYLRCYWTLKMSTPPVSNSGQRLLTEGLEFTFNLAAPMEVVNSDGRAKTMFETGITGPMTRPMMLKSTGPVNLFGICFRPGGSYPFFKTPTHELANQYPDVLDLWGSEGRRFVERIQNDCATTQSRIETIDCYLSNRVEKHHPDDTITNAALEAIERHKGRLTIDQLARYLGLSCRHLERKFRERIGVTPKQLCRNMRFKHLYKYMEISFHKNWADVALACGFYDQAHMINDFKYFTGTSPASYFNNPANGPNFFTANF